MLPYRNLSQREARNFITDFKPEENKIIVNYANKTNQEIENTDGNKENLIKKMENQVLNNKDKTQIELHSSTYWLIPVVTNGYMAAKYISILITELISKKFESHTAKLAALFAVMSYFVTQYYLNLIEIYNDHYKNEMFLENKYMISKIFTDNIQIPKKKKRLVKKIRNLTDNNETLDINNIAEFSVGEIMYLIDLVRNEGIDENPILRFFKRRY